MRTLLLIAVINFLCLPLQAQEINWLTFPQLSEALAKKPKPVLIFFYTDWCSYCRKMEREVFSKPTLIDSINNQYYAVKFNAESKESFHFEGQLLKNAKPKQARSLHDITLLLANRKQGIAFPTTIILDEEFRVRSRHMSYLSSQQLMAILGF